MTKWIFSLVLTFAALAWADPGEYKRLVERCRSCNEIQNLVVQHDKELSPDNRLDLALKVADAIKRISLRGKSDLDQRREIYFAIDGAIQVLNDDFDSETCVRLLDLRMASPKNFDYVLWRFPLVHQNNLIGRMQSFKNDKIRPKAVIPVAKLIEDP